MKNRLDVELVNRGIASSRTKAKELIENSAVVVNGKVITKSSEKVENIDSIVLKESSVLKYVSRGGLKLEKALNEFKISLKNRNVIDIGSSTGGFTDCALKFGAKKVLAIDVGTNVMSETLRNDKRVELHENINFRELESSYFKNIDFAVCDVSFISLKMIISKLFEENVEIEGVFLIKPQFECGKDLAKKYKGIILDKKVHINIINELINYFNSLNFFVRAVTVSPIKGGDGNIEYLVYLSNKDKNNTMCVVEDLVNEAFSNK